MLPKGKPQEGQLIWMLLLAAGWMVLGSARGSSSSSSDLHLLSPTSGAPPPPALPRPNHPQGPQGPRHHQPPVSIYRSPASLRAGHGESRHLSPCFYLPLVTGSPARCPFIIMNDQSEKEPPVTSSLSFSVSLYITSSLPPSHCPSVIVFLLHSPSHSSFHHS